jgi:hypothetical protein
MAESLFAEANDRLKQKMVKETEWIWEIAQQKSISMRTAAYVHAVDRIAEAIDAKRVFEKSTLLRPNLRKSPNPLKKGAKV